jgi:hypothetical protein
VPAPLGFEQHRKGNDANEQDAEDDHEAPSEDRVSEFKRF